MSWHCSGCGESGIAPGLCDRCHHEYVPDLPSAHPPRQIHRRPWRHFESANAVAAFAGVDVRSRWFDALLVVLKVALWIALAALPIPIAARLPESIGSWFAGFYQLWLYGFSLFYFALWPFFARRLGGRAYRALAAIALNEPAIRRRARFTPLSALAEGRCVVIGETTPVETVSIPGSTPALAFQGADYVLNLKPDPYVQYDGSGTEIRPSVGGDFVVSDGAGGSLVIRAEHVVIESPRLDVTVPIGSRLAVSGNVAWVVGEEGYRGGHGHWEMVGTWDEPIILHVLRAGPDLAASTTGLRIDSPGAEPLRSTTVTLDLEPMHAEADDASRGEALPDRAQR